MYIPKCAFVLFEKHVLLNVQIIYMYFKKTQSHDVLEKLKENLSHGFNIIVFIFWTLGDIKSIWIYKKKVNELCILSCSLDRRNSNMVCSISQNGCHQCTIKIRCELKCRWILFENCIYIRKLHIFPNRMLPLVSLYDTFCKKIVWVVHLFFQDCS